MSNNTYKEEDTKFNQQLCQELKRYLTDLKATQEELSEGLRISRQSLVSFLQSPNKGLPIKRSNLIALWQHLTDQEKIKNKKLSESAKINRKQLRKQGVDRLLQLAGYLPTSSDFDNSYQSCIFNNTVVDWSDNFEEKLENWCNQFEISSFVRNPLEKEMKRICKSGINLFDDCEIYELAKCLEVNEAFAKSINRDFVLKVVGCSFTDLTFNVEEKFKTEELKEYFIDASNNAESLLRSKHLSGISITLDLPPVIKVSIKCRFIGKQSEPVIYWDYISDNTHIENAFSAVAKGMGYASSLALQLDNIKTIGEKDNSLVKTFSILVSRDDESKKYEGIWVDRSTVTCSIQSTVIAATKWLYEYVDNISLSNYIDISQKVSALENKLNKSRKTLDGYLFDGINNSEEKNLTISLNEVIKEIERIMFRYNTTKYYQFYQPDLYRQYCTAYWILARSANVQGDLKLAKEYLKKMNKYLSEVKDYVPIQILYEIEEVVRQFFRRFSTFI